MPYRRDIITSTNALLAERIVLLQTGTTWSPEYATNVFKLIVPLEGYAFVRTSHGEDLVDFATVLSMAPDAPYRMRQPVPQSCLVLSIRDSECVESLQFQLRSQRGACVPAPIDPRSTAAIQRLAAGNNDALDAEEHLLHTASLLLSANDPTRSKSIRTANTRNQRATVRARQFLAERYCDAIALTDVAQFANTSPFHLSRLFRARYGVGVFAFRERLRITSALRALSQQHADLTELAHALGYASHSHFSAAFRRAIGCTPSTWARRDF